MDYIITTEQLTKKYKNFISVNHVSLHIRKGSIYGFLGPNGAGKSTTMKKMCIRDRIKMPYFRVKILELLLYLDALELGSGTEKPYLFPMPYAGFAGVRRREEIGKNPKEKKKPAKSPVA